jgi:hypothetical protein
MTRLRTYLTGKVWRSCFIDRWIEENITIEVYTILALFLYWSITFIFFADGWTNFGVVVIINSKRKDYMVT